MTTFYLDVSHYDVDRRGGPLDWVGITALGMPAVCVRATYGDPGVYAPTTRHFRALTAGAEAAGVGIRGGYHNLIGGDASSIARQVLFLRDELDAAGSNWAMLDVEPYAALRERGLVPGWEDVLEFAAQWRLASRIPLAFYIARWVWDGYLGRPDLRKLGGPLVSARYIMGATPGPAGDLYAGSGGDTGAGWEPYGGVVPDIWQFTSSAQVLGASAFSDVNAFRGTAAELRALLVRDGGTVASSGYNDWIRAGRPWNGTARPLASLKGRLRGYGYTVYDYPDDSHLTAAVPEDHAPFGVTGWPGTNARWFGFADDIMPPPAGSGLPSLQQIGARIYADKQAGDPALAWLKYMNWEPNGDGFGPCYHDSWQPNHVRVSSTDRRHIHLSARSDALLDTRGDAYDPVARIRGQQSAGMGDKMLTIFYDGTGYGVGDGINRRTIMTWEEMLATQAAARAGTLGSVYRSGEIVTTDNARVYGVAVDETADIDADTAQKLTESIKDLAARLAEEDNDLPTDPALIEQAVRESMEELASRVAVALQGPEAGKPSP